MTMTNSVKRAWALGALAVAILAVTGFNLFIGATYEPRGVPIFYTSSTAWDTANSGGIGGEVKVFLADSTLRVGAVAFISTRGHVKGSATLTDFNNAIAGIVVGGDSTGLAVPLTIADTAAVAAKINNKVLVMSRGRYWILDSALNCHVIGGALRPSGTNQRSALRLAPIDSFNRIYAKVIDTTGTGSAVLAQINVK